MDKGTNTSHNLDMTEYQRVHAIDDVKNSLQSQSILFNDFNNPLHHTLYGKFNFDQFLIDSQGQYWFTEKMKPGKETTRIFIFDAHGSLLKSLAVKGKPTLYEYDQCTIAACEGSDDKGYIYRFCKVRLQSVEEWVIDGFLWDLECVGETMYITSYLADWDEAVLYKINKDMKEELELGSGVFPTGILNQDDTLYIALSFLNKGTEGKIIKCDLDGNILAEMEIDIAPRQLFSYKNHLILHGMDMAKGSADHLVYFNIDDGSRTLYKIPKATDIRQQGKHMLFYNRDTQSVLYWSHEKRRVIRLVHWPYRINKRQSHELTINH